jgi:hypothetical protein
MPLPSTPQPSIVHGLFRTDYTALKWVVASRLRRRKEPFGPNAVGADATMQSQQNQ